MSGEKQIESTDWLTRDIPQEQLEREKRAAIMSADLELCHTEFADGNGDIYTDYDVTAEKMVSKGYRKHSDDGLILTFDGATGYFPKEFIIESIKTHMKQKEGQWEKRVFIVFDSEKVGYRCSGCNTTWDTATHYCPNCGAKMKGENE